MNYDIIGDLHGDARRLDALLAKLGYRDINGAWRKSGHQALFVGDFIDRGPEQWRTCSIVRRMVDAGSALALLGNHEFNSIAWFVQDATRPGEYLRRHTQSNRQGHQDFLSEVEGTPRHKELIDWFLTLPMWIELDGLRAIHACWHPAYMAEIAPLLQPGRTLNAALVASASRPDDMAFRTVEGLLKGLEVALPDGHTFIDKSGHARSMVRVRWWDANATTFRQAGLLDDGMLARLPDATIPPEFRIGYTDTKPVFFGHYSLPGQPAILAPNVACVDFYDKADNRLAAYQWDGESCLENAKFVVA